jgi:hypothetical protein
MEMLYTPVHKPQVRVQVNGLDAVCPEQNCDYVYTENLDTDVGMRRNLDEEPSVYNFEYEAFSKTLTIEGSNFVDRECGKPGISVDFAKQTCKINSESQTIEFIECSIKETPVAGSHTVVVRDSCGSFDASSTDPIDIELIVDSISPAQISQLGQDMITITGSGFGNEMDLVQVEIIQSDTDEIEQDCKIYSV